jgi:hypothetical protein
MAMLRVAPSYRISTFVLAAVTLSIGWGVRGNWGHEFGAMLPGALCGIVVCLMSGREDWRRRVLYFAMFGAIGWAFGGSMSYMQILTYTGAGNTPGSPLAPLAHDIIVQNRIYGYIGTFMLGFLWAGMGGMGTAYPALESRERLTALFKPLCWVFALWAVYYFAEDHLDQWYANLRHGAGNVKLRDSRQASPFYWLDTDWIQAFLVLVGICLFDFWDRLRNRPSIDMLFAPIFAALGAVLGWGVQQCLTYAGATNWIAKVLVQPQGDITRFRVENLVTNWPRLFFDCSDHLGWAFGLLFGIALYFAIFGQWRCNASLPLVMALGWFAGFLLMPVLGSLIHIGSFRFSDYGGFRMTAPRGDNWAGLVGLFIATAIYMFRRGFAPVNLAALVCGIVGGLGLMLSQLLFLLAHSVGNANLGHDAAKWSFWRDSNWHSILREQGAGLFYGLGLALAMGLLATRAKPIEDDDPPVRRWTEAFAAFFLLNLLLYVNFVKNIGDWVTKHGDFQAVPSFMRIPLLDNFTINLHNICGQDWLASHPGAWAFHGYDLSRWIVTTNLSAWAWFTIMWALLTLMTIDLLRAHLQRPLAVIPKSSVGKGQLFFLVFLWAVILANLMKALTGFAEQRLDTEGVIFINGIIATFMILMYVRDHDTVTIKENPRYGLLWTAVILLGVLATGGAVYQYTKVSTLVYGDVSAGVNMRFGPQADWFVKPIQKTKPHN